MLYSYEVFTCRLYANCAHKYMTMPFWPFRTTQLQTSIEDSKLSKNTSMALMSTLQSFKE